MCLGVVSVMAKREALDVWARLAWGQQVSREELLEAARFSLCVSARRRAARYKVYRDLEAGLHLLKQAGFERDPRFPQGMGK